jgi:hypothetical protein
MYRFPWSRTDNPGGWVEVTDDCNLHCQACYRHRLEGHRPVAEVKDEILAHRRHRNCDRIAIAGGEPLIYPNIVEIVEFIARQDMKPMILTNGENLDWDLATQLRKAGLTQFYFHVDSGQNRPGWAGRSEEELNALRQQYADLCWELDGVQCGYNTTVYRSTLDTIPGIVRWARQNLHKVQHLSLIAFRALPVSEDTEFLINGERTDVGIFQSTSTDLDAISITSDEMFDVLKKELPGLHPSAYLNGTTAPKTHKFVLILTLGSKNEVFGEAGAKTVEIDQTLYHLRHGRYSASMENPRVGKKAFFLSIVDREVRRSFLAFLKSCMKHPRRVFDDVYIQAMNLQQPNEIIDGETNLCEGCVNMMLYRGEWIHSCRLDEYRVLGGPITTKRVTSPAASSS